MALGCKSFLLSNELVYACQKRGNGHAGLHSTDNNYKEDTLGWGKHAPGAITAPIGVRYIAVRGKDHQSEDTDNIYDYMGIKDVMRNTYEEGPFAYEDYEAFQELQAEASDKQADWENRLKLLDAEAINTDTCFVTIKVDTETLSLRPSEYTKLFEEQSELSDFDVEKHAFITYHMPSIPIYDGKTASELHEEFMILVAAKVEERVLVAAF